MSMKGRPATVHHTVGQIFGKWTVIGQAVSSSRGRWHLCVCECGTERMVIANGLSSGKSRSCGCSKVEIGHKRTTHGDSNRLKSTLYPTWQGMKTRCTNPKVGCFYRYGGRGIKVCDEWLVSYESFKSWAISHGWQHGLELDRRDNNGNYCPENCQWVTHAVNMANSSPARHITAWDETKSISEWAADPRCAVSRSTLSSRLNKKHWTNEQSISINVMPLGQRHSAKYHRSGQ